MTNPILMKEPSEAAPSKAEQRLRAQVEAVGAVSWFCAPSGLVVEPQPGWMAFTGQTAEEALGEGWTKAVHPKDLASMLLNWREAVARAEPHSTEIRVRRHDGQWRWMSVRVAPVRDESGEIVEWCGMNIDITERKQAEATLRANEERFRLFMDNSPAIGWMKDEDGRHVYFSRTFERRFGAQAADWLGRTDFRAVAAGSRGGVSPERSEGAKGWPPDRDRRGNAGARRRQVLLAEHQIPLP